MISKMTDHRLTGERSPELISSEFSLKLQAALKFGAWANWEFVNPVLHNKFSSGSIARQYSPHLDQLDTGELVKWRILFMHFLHSGYKTTDMINSLETAQQKAHFLRSSAKITAPWLTTEIECPIFSFPPLSRRRRRSGCLLWEIFTHRGGWFLHC